MKLFEKGEKLKPPTSEIEMARSMQSEKNFVNLKLDIGCAVGILKFLW